MTDLCSSPGAEAQGDWNVVIVRAPVDHSKYESALLFHERLVAVLGATHALASHKRLRLAALASEPLLMHERGVDPGLDDKTFALYAAAGARPHVVEAQPPPCSPGALMLLASCQGFYLGTASPFTQTHRTKQGDNRSHRRARRASRGANRVAEARFSRHVRDFLRSARDVFP